MTTSNDPISARTPAWAVFAGLALLMAATRLRHFGTALLLPDASWAVFFLAGFYLRRDWRWALPLLLLEAIVIDGIAIRDFTVSNYCVTIAYGILPAAYALLWLGGRWLRRHYRHEAADVIRLGASLLASVTLCYLLTNGSFYWLSGRVPDATLAGWLQNLTDWYGNFIGVASGYVGVAALAHALLARRLRHVRSAGP
jgi:hypothetical protein